MIDQHPVPQAGAIPWRWFEARLEVLLITNTNATRWQVPKGNIDPFETPIQAAAKECYEEAGIIGEVHHRPVGNWIYSKRGMLYIVDVYPLHVTEILTTYPEHGMRERVWVEARRAGKQVKDHGLRELVDTLPLFLARHGLLRAA